MEIAIGGAGVLVGFALSALFWWVLNHVLVPQISFEGISKRNEANGDLAYRVRIENSGRRNVIDLDCRARLFIPNKKVLSRVGAPTSQIVDIPLKEDHFFVLRSRRRRVLWLEPGRVDSPLVPADTAQAGRPAEPGPLEALFARWPESYFRLQILAYDSFSGARKFYESPDYTPADIGIDRF